ncbi:c-type cytochrome biogenesis protein CcmI [Vibrio sp. 2-Bac 85]
MILQFVIAALLLLLVFSVVMVTHFVRDKAQHRGNEDRRNQLNHELYDIRLKEVEDDLSQGVVVDKEAMVAELQYNLLDDIDEDKQSKQNNAQRIWVPGVVFLVLATVALYWSVGAFQEVNNWQQTLQRYPEIHKKLFEENDARPNEQELQDLMLGLRTHLANQPNDAEGWVLYSRLGRVFKDKELALDAIKKAVDVAPENPEIELEYIELKMKIGDEYSKATAPLMLKNFLQRYPDNYDAWSMYGFMALQQENFAGAVERWQKMLSLVDPKSEKAIMLSNSIDYAKKQLAQQQLAQQQSEQAAATGTQAEGVDSEQKLNTNQETAKAQASPAVVGAAYQVNITVAQQVSYTENSTLFVYAQAVNGPAMPIAAVKLPVNEFPVKVVLSDANAMMQGIKLSDHKQFIIKARISADGTVNKTNGQWSGVSQVIKAGQKAAVNIEINQQS